MKAPPKGLALCAGAGLALTLGVAALRGLFAAAATAYILAALCDGLFTAGILLFGLGILSWVAGQGVFDGLRFTLKSIFNLRWPFVGKGDYMQRYADYLAQKRARRRPPTALLLTGGGYLLLSGLALVFYFVIGGA